MSDTTEREALASRISTLCADFASDQALYETADDDEADAILQRNAKRLEGLEAAVADLARRPIRNVSDLRRRATVVLQYQEIIGPDTPCFLKDTLKKVLEYARGDLLPVTVGVLALLLEIGLEISV